jgi:diguanylate cyclase (GGDEF)-like protein/PAS domain S-box-containing protein
MDNTLKSSDLQLTQGAASEPTTAAPKAVSEKSDQLLAAFEPQRDFCRIFQDAYVLVDDKGHIVKHNQMFCLLTGTKAAELRKSPLLIDILNAPEDSGDFARLLTGLQPMRFDEMAVMRMRTAQTLTVIASSYPYIGSDGQHLGTCLLLRDVTAESSLQGKYTERTMESLTDPLTGLFSRRFIERLFSGESLDVSGTGLGSTTLSVLMCDVDHFKRINDSHGHLGGDAVLKAVANELRKACRSTDRVARYGGEEFAIILPDTALEGACVVAEKIRKAVAATRVSFEGQEIRVTISIGGTERQTRLESMKSLFARADECLYKAKAAGRNRSIMAGLQGLLEASTEDDWHPLTERQAS